MAHSRTARPLHRNIAGLGKLQQALVYRTPRHIETAPRKGDHRAGTGASRRWVRRPGRSLGDARRHRFLGTEDLLVDSPARNAPVPEILREAAKECSRATQIKV